MRIDGPIDTSQVELGGGGRRGGRGMAVGGGGVGLVGLVIYLLVNALGGGGGGLPIDTGFNNVPAAQANDPRTKPLSCPAGSAKSDVRCQVTAVVNDVQAVWDKEFTEAGREYEPTKLQFFTGGTSTACGNATSATGPFYCPGDRKVYIDVSFFNELSDRFGAPGDFAQAYVIAHEFGHHVQTVLGIERQVRQLQQEDRGRANELSVRMELQADCLAGLWAHDTQQVGSAQGNVADVSLDPGDIEEAIGAASAIGDDRLQRQSGGSVDPDSFTHGTSEQRVKWFRVGAESGSLDSCDTFSGDI